MAIETMNKAPVMESNTHSNRTPPKVDTTKSAFMPQHVREYLLRFPNQRREIEIELRKRGEFVHDFSCFHCGFVLDERDICINCGLTSVRIMTWVCMQPEKYEEMGEDDISGYKRMEKEVKQKYRARFAKFALGDDPF